MKQCTGKCGQIRPLSEFSVRKASKDGLQKKCKVCQSENIKQQYLTKSKYYKEKTNHHYQYNKEDYIQRSKLFKEQLKDGKSYVYYLPEVNYVGVTDNLYDRMAVHKSYNNISTTSSYQIIGKFDNRETAERFEAYKHSLGYLSNGKNLLNT